MWRTNIGKNKWNLKFNLKNSMLEKNLQKYFNFSDFRLSIGAIDYGSFYDTLQSR